MDIKVPNPINLNFSPEHYFVDEALRNAVEVAIALNQPLLLTGEPGTGKTKLAWKIAYDLAQGHSGYCFIDTPYVFNTKTSSSARDLFYLYDALGHFQVANIRRSEVVSMPHTSDFIDLQALGRAIAQTAPENFNKMLIKSKLEAIPKSSVVLIDEIDKAPRDFPNDLLNEIENQEFAIKELDNFIVQKGEKEKIVIILTSNSEKNLPDAFLRRCVFYHIPFPDSNHLFKIVKGQLGSYSVLSDEMIAEFISIFETIRKQAIRKPPATAELIAWLRVLEMRQVHELSSERRLQELRHSLPILIKTKEDLYSIKNFG